MSFSMPTTAATSESEALKLSYDAMAIGADSILCGTWSLKFINALSNAGIPTEGHLGLVPRRSTWTGGLRAVGKTINQAKKIDSELEQRNKELEIVKKQLSVIKTKKRKESGSDSKQIVESASHVVASVNKRLQDTLQELDMVRKILEKEKAEHNKLKEKFENQR